MGKTTNFKFYGRESGAVDSSSGIPDKVLNKPYNKGKWKSWRHSYYIVLSGNTTEGLLTKANKKGITIISIADLF